MNIFVIILSIAFIALELYMVCYVGKKMIIVKKKNSISRDYPRKAGIPSKNPL